MKKYTDKLQEFNTTFGFKTNQSPTLEEGYELRHELMLEEAYEYFDACEENNLVGIADALGDQLYILCGTILHHGMQHIIEDCFNEIHRSNMSKADENGKAIINGENGVLDETRPLGKLLKSSRYTEPNLAQFL